MGHSSMTQHHLITGEKNVFCSWDANAFWATAYKKKSKSLSAKRARTINTIAKVISSVYVYFNSCCTDQLKSTVRDYNNMLTHTIAYLLVHMCSRQACHCKARLGIRPPLQCRVVVNWFWLGLNLLTDTSSFSPQKRDCFHSSLTQHVQFTVWASLLA